MIDTAKAYAAKRRVTLVGALVNLLLAIVKIVIGHFGRSQALIADGVHSLSDLLSDALVLAAARFGSQGPDAEHPYGHARIETAATVGVAALLVFVAIAFVADGGSRVAGAAPLATPSLITAVAAAVSIAAKEALYWYTVYVARALRSGLIEANAWHHRTDALSSVVALVGIGGALLGAPWMDPLAAVVVALLIGHMGWRLGARALRELIDTGLDRRGLAAMRARIDAVPGVRSHHGLRTRRMGGDVLADVHVCVDPDLTVSEAHRIAEDVRAMLQDGRDDITDVVVHVDPGTPAQAAAGQSLPSPAEVRARLATVWPPASDPERTTIALHYRHQRIDVDVLLGVPGALDPVAALEALSALRAEGSWLGRVRLLTTVGQQS